MKKNTYSYFAISALILVSMIGCRDEVIRDSTSLSNENSIMKIDSLRLGINEGRAVWIFGITWKTSEPFRMIVRDKTNSTEIFNSSISPNQSKKYTYSTGLAVTDPKNNWIFIDKDSSSSRSLEFSIEQSGQISKLETTVEVSALVKQSLHHKLK
ncbi:hypothetical protein [Leptospira sp. GIMC2001]|uniref:hypothetical protein n=1 Tax=Leptospira sp. GIMC2001 TaxID=1513297 RepID=UPI00234AD7C0|nr:hypothetical protein [Leptospira sp. GIMC2001]WCL48859.1 hypothetical protein O4O04_16365 [Leptospira sp. GIMC2001]